MTPPRLTHAIAATAVLGALAVTVGLPATAAAQPAPGQTRATDPGFYIRGSLGYSWSFEDEIDYSPVWGVGAGYRFNQNWRMDVTADWRDRYIIEGAREFAVGGTVVDSQLDNRAFMVNAYYDLRRFPVISLPDGFRPYVGAGVGLSTIEVDDAVVGVDLNDDDVVDEIRDFLGDEDDQLAWQIMVGAAYNFTDNAFVDVGYRYADLGEAELTSIQGDISNDLNVHEIMLTLGYRF